MTRFPLPRAPLSMAAALLLAAGSAHAVDFTGYFRAGPGGTQHGESRACYALNGGTNGMKYRLGNECDIYGEFQLAQGFKKDGIDYKVVLMTDYWNPHSDADDAKHLRLAQMYTEAKGFDFAPEMTVWAGKERGRRGDVHIVDTYFTEMAGIGAGFKGLNVGPGKLGVAYYTNDKDTNQRPGHRGNFEYMDVATGQDGALNIFGTVTKSQFAGGTNGWGLALRHNQNKLFGTSLNNVIWVQCAQGSAGLNSNFGDQTATSAAKKFRVVESVNFQEGAWGGMGMLLWANEKDNAGKATVSTSVGGRISYGVTRNFKLLTEAGVSQYKPDGGQTARLTKVTFAPTLSTGPGLMDRPEFRLYVTHAKWNKAAGNVTGQPGFENETSGTSFGAQVEVWF